MLIFSLLGGVALFVCPRKASEKIEADLEELTKDKTIQRRDLEMAAGGKKKANFHD